LPCIIHALLVVADYKAEQRAKRYARPKATTVYNLYASDESPRRSRSGQSETDDWLDNLQ